MSPKQVQDTREKILMVAHELFAKNGFHGTSIRELAKQADVNVAAINYHFENKEKLYWTTFQCSYEWLDEGIKEVAKSSTCTSDLAVNIFDHMMANGTSIVNAFKMMLNDSFTMPKDFQEQSDHNFGPPGGEIIFNQLKAELPDDTPEYALIWGVRGIFTYLAHWALMMNTSYCRDLKKDDPDFSKEGKERSIRLHVESILAYIEMNPEKFSD